MKNKIALSLALLAAGLAVAACESKAKPAPARENLIGYWTLETDSYSSVRANVKIDPKKASLDFRADGTFIAVNFPFENIDKFASISGTGRWEYPTIFGDRIDLTLDKAGHELFVKREETGALRLYHAVGDPDSAERWTWKKTVRR